MAQGVISGAMVYNCGINRHNSINTFVIDSDLGMLVKSIFTNKRIIIQIK